MGDVQGRVIGNLSRGFRQRVGLAQALLHNPPVLILDEPTVGLDPNQIIEIRDLIKSLAGSHTIILSTHILPEATALCQRVIIIHQGRIAAVDTPDQLSARLRQSEKLSLTVKAPLPTWDQLQTVSGVLNVVAGSTPNTFIVEAELGHDIREDVTQFVVQRGLGLLELKSLSMSLEDVFIRLTQDETLRRARRHHLLRDPREFIEKDRTLLMTPVQTIIAKELRCYFVSPIVYVIGAVFLGIVGLLSYWAVVNAGNQALRMMQMTNTFAQINLNDLVFRPNVLWHESGIDVGAPAIDHARIRRRTKAANL